MPSVGVAEFLFRVVVGVFFSAMLGLVGWLAGRLLFVSFFVITEDGDRLVAVLAIGIGTGIGGSAASLMLGLSRSKLGLRVLIIVAAAVLGAAVGLRFGMDAYVPAGMPGIPELGGIVRGAMITANLTPITLDLVVIYRERRRRRSQYIAGV